MNYSASNGKCQDDYERELEKGVEESSRYLFLDDIPTFGLKN
jgi:hypothetical protein